MGAVRLVDEHQHAVGVRQPDDRAQVGADAVVGRVVDQHRLGVGIGLDRRLQVGERHPERNAQIGVHLRVDVDGNRAVDDERVDRRAVDVARQNDLLTGLDGGEDHSLDGGGRAVDDEERIVRLERLGRQALRILDDRHGMRQIVQRLHRVHVQRHQLGAEVVVQCRVHPAALVPGHVKMRQTVDPLLFQSVGDRCVRLLERFHPLLVLAICYPLTMDGRGTPAPATAAPSSTSALEWRTV